VIKNILLPLDGSKLAETAIPAALWLRNVYHAQITLVHIIEHNAPASVHGDYHIKNEEEAIQYLNNILSTLKPEIDTEYHVHADKVRDVPSSIAEHVSELSQDIIVMCSHGGGGIRQIMVGNIAQQIIAKSKVPILLIQPKKNAQYEFQLPKKMLVGLDEEPEHRCRFGYVVDLAKFTHMEILLLNVVPSVVSLFGKEAATSKLTPSATRAVLEMEVKESENRLSEIAAQWMEKGLTISYKVVRGDPATQIARVAVEESADLISLFTHGKSGMNAFWAGSVAPRVPNFTDLPLLLIPCG
jgi:nucleotide-binding universal stress UspA family protein